MLFCALNWFGKRTDYRSCLISKSTFCFSRSSVADFLGRMIVDKNVRKRGQGHRRRSDGDRPVAVRCCRTKCQWMTIRISKCRSPKKWWRWFRGTSRLRGIYSRASRQSQIFHSSPSSLQAILVLPKQIESAPSAWKIFVCQQNQRHIHFTSHVKNLTVAISRRSTRKKTKFQIYYIYEFVAVGLEICLWDRPGALITCLPCVVRLYNYFSIMSILISSVSLVSELNQHLHDAMQCSLTIAIETGVQRALDWHIEYSQMFIFRLQNPKSNASYGPVSNLFDYRLLLFWCPERNCI